MFFADYIEECNAYGVFYSLDDKNGKSGFCYATFCSEEEAETEANNRNILICIYK